MHGISQIDGLGRHRELRVFICNMIEKTSPLLAQA
jgi:hypothetical protein